MKRVSLLMRRIAGLTRAVFGGGRARRRLKELRRVDLSQYVNRIISDAVLLNEIPSPTEAESRRMDFIAARLRDFGISNVVTDEAGNVAALFPAFGTRPDFLLVFAEVGDADYSPLGNSVNLTKERAAGHGVAERSAGAAALLVFAEYAQATGFYLDKNLLLLFTPSSSVDENSAALRSFLSEWGGQISGGLFIRGSGLGTVETRQVGTYWLSVDVRKAERDLLQAGDSASAATILGAIAFQIGAITWDPGKTTIVSIARMQAGIGYGHWPSEGTMDVEILSEQEALLETAKNTVMATIQKIASGEEAQAEVTVRAHHSVGDSQRNAPITAAVQETLTQLRIKPETGVITEKIAMLNEFGIPGAALGITSGKVAFDEEYIDLPPLETGFRQLLLVVERRAGVSNSKEIELQ